MSDEKVYENRPTFSIFRANKDKNGAACRFQLSPAKDDRKPCLFLEMAKQTGEDNDGNAAFGWRRWNKEDKTFDNANTSVSMKLGTADIGEMLAVISGRKDAVGTGKGLYHDNGKGSSTLEFKLYAKDAQSPPTTFILNTSSKLKEAKDAIRVGHSLSFAEAEVLRVFLEKALVEINEWNL